MAHQFRLFIGYSDPEAKEVGRVYQACNFMFLGHDYGTTVLYCDPERPDEWFTDRHVRHRTAYQKYAAEAGIPWKDEWVEGNRLVGSDPCHQLLGLLREGAAKGGGALIAIFPPRGVGSQIP